MLPVSKFEGVYKNDRLTVFLLDDVLISLFLTNSTEDDIHVFKTTALRLWN